MSDVVPSWTNALFKRILSSALTTIDSNLDVRDWRDERRLSTDAIASLHRLSTDAIASLHRLSTDAIASLHRLSTDAIASLHRLSTDATASVVHF